jgi:hypothetical protein
LVQNIQFSKALTKGVLQHPPKFGEISTKKMAMQLITGVHRLLVV